MEVARDRLDGFFPREEKHRIGLETGAQTSSASITAAPASDGI